MRTAVALIIVGLLAWAAPAAADEIVLQYGDTTPSEFDGAADLAYWTDYKTPDDWTDVVCSQVRFFGKGYGDNSKTLGTMVVYGPAEGDIELYESDGDLHQIITRKVFELDSVPEEGAWITLDFEPVKLPGEIAIVIYTYNTEERGVELGLTEPNFNTDGRSGIFLMEKKYVKDTRKTKWRHSTDYRQDGRHWMIQAVVANTLPPVEKITTDGISGKGFVYHDDGTVDGYITSQRHGPMVKFDAGSGKTVDRVYVYGQLDGAWFQTEKLAIAYLLDQDHRIIGREVLRYDRFVNEPCWGAVDFADVKVTGEYFVLIEPLAKLDVQLMIGFDESGENVGSLWGTAGAVGSWDTTAPEELTNWMIRAHYK